MASFYMLGTFEEELRLQTVPVFQRLRDANLKLYPKKSHLFRSQGNIITKDGVQTDLDIDAVRAKRDF